MSGSSRLTLCAALACAGFTFVHPATAGTFDGHWAVQIAATSGPCPASGRWTLGIFADRIAESGLLSSTSGAVDGAGRVVVNIEVGGDRMVASGTLADRSGSGAWTSPTRGCSGSWHATRL